MTRSLTIHGLSRVLVVRIVGAGALAVSAVAYSAGTLTYGLFIVEAALVGLGALRWGRALALVTSVLATMAGLLSSGFLARTLSLPWWAVILATSLALGGVGLALLRDEDLRIIRGDGTERGRIAWWAILAGPLSWTLVALASLISPRGAPRAWAMKGDSANNLLIAREMLLDHGLIPANPLNPVPLNQVLVAAQMAPHRVTSSIAANTARDLTALSTTWHILIVLTGLMAAVLTWRIARAASRQSRTVVTLAVAGSSMAIHTWVFTAMPVSFGFLNVHVFAPTAIAGMVAFSARRAHPVAAAVSLLVLAGLIAASWSPFVLVPLLLLAIHAIQQRSALRSWRPHHVVGVIAAGLWASGVVALTALPGLVKNAGVLGSDGGITPIMWWYAPALLSACLVLALSVRLIERRDAPEARDASVLAVATTLSLGAGLAFLLFAPSAQHSTLWSYYPTKFAWTTAVVAIPVILGLAAAVASSWRPSRVPRATTTLVFAVACAFALAAAMPRIASGDGIDVRGNVEAAALVAGSGPGVGDAVADYAVALADDDSLRVMARTSTGVDAAASFWSIQLQIPRISSHLGSSAPGEDMRWYAYYYADLTTPQWCDLARKANTQTVVFTESDEFTTGIALLDCDTPLTAKPLGELTAP